MNEIEFNWNINVEPLKLGSLLMFRKAVENYLEFEGSGQASLNFIQDKWSAKSSVCLIQTVFQDTGYNVRFLTENLNDKSDPLQGSFNYYSTWYGIDDQISRGRGKQKLSWVKHRDLPFNNYVTCHLCVEREDEVKQIYHARTNEWLKFFQLKKNQKFLLLGDDPYPSEITSLKNVEVAKDFDLNLNQQLALIDASKAFFGSASGIAAAAVLSSVPFLIFKHPNHHPWEYITPKFLKSDQKQVRQIDTLENILKEAKV